jgi:formylglycine-generating enzyme required for sulfatase activity
MTATLLIHEPLGSRQAATPLRIGAAPAGLVIPGTDGTVASIDEDAGQWWLRPAGDAGDVQVNGELLRQPVVLADGDVLQSGAAQIVFSASGPALHVAHLAGNATVAPLQQALLPGEAVTAGSAEIQAAVDAVADAATSSATAPARRRTAGWRVIVPLALAGMLALGLLFRLTTVPLVLSPQAAAIEVPGWLNWRGGDRLYLMPGEHVISVSAPGYASRRIEVDAAAAAAAGSPLQIALTLLPGEVVIDTQGIAGEVLLDGRSVGRAPGPITATAGTHEISIRAPRHVEFTARVVVQGGGRSQPLQATLVPAYGWVLLDTRPGNAEVRVDDQPRGRAPLKLELDAGLRRLSLSAPGRRGWNSQVAVLAGQTLDLGVIDLAVPAPVMAATTPVASDSAPEGTSPPAPLPPPPPPARIQSPLLGTLLLLPPGTFSEGSERREQGRRSNEVLRQVTLSRAFYLAEREVTNAQFRAFRANHASGLAMEKSLDLDNQAVTGVSWSDAVEFCNWLSLREGLPAAYERRDGRWQLVQPRNQGYRLPTEAEWEYAARRVDGQQWRRYAWGDALPPPAGAANLGGQESLPQRPGPDVRLAAALPGYSDEHAVVAPVGSYARSASGFHDLGGNVSEWVHDVYASMPEAQPVTDPLGPEVDGPHAIRGANWRTAAIAELRLAWRERAASASQTIGFRVARSVEGTP